MASHAMGMGRPPMPGGAGNAKMLGNQGVLGPYPSMLPPLPQAKLPPQHQTHTTMMGSTQRSQKVSILSKRNSQSYDTGDKRPASKNQVPINRVSLDLDPGVMTDVRKVGTGSASTRGAGNSAAGGAVPY